MNYTSSDAQSSNYSLGPGPPNAMVGNPMGEPGAVSSPSQVEWIPEGNSSNNGVSDSLTHGEHSSVSLLEQGLFRINLQEGSGQQQIQHHQQHLQSHLPLSQLQSQTLAQRAYTFTSPLPERPGEPDCVYFLRTGQCGYGMACKFNHPPNRIPVNRGPLDYPERPGQPECQYYLKTGTCKFGSTCKYDHPREKAGIANPATQQPQVPLNYAGLPIRVGEQDCAFYMKTGLCKYGQSCRFNHPPVPTGSFSPSPTLTPNSPGPSTHSIPGLPWQLNRSPFIANSRLPIPSPYPTVVVPAQPGIMTLPPWPYQSSIPQSPSPDTSQQQQPQGSGSHYVTSVQLDNSIPNPSSPYQSQVYSSLGSSAQSPYQSSLVNKDSFPQRVGQPECQYYMKTGDCKFGVTCKFHHPKNRSVPSPNSLLSALGLPLRPGAQVCTFYIKYGACKFGQSCKFDHPVRSHDYSQTSQQSYLQGIQSPSYPIPYQYPITSMENIPDVNISSSLQSQPEAYRSENATLSSDSPDRPIYTNSAAESSSS